MTTRTALAALVALLVTLAPASVAVADTSFQARGSVEQVYVTKLAPGVPVELLDSTDSVVASRAANGLGGALFRKVTPGDGYRVRSGSETSEPLTVLTKESAPPSAEIYNQAIPQNGYGYLTTRDGTKLAYSVHPPQDIQNDLPAPAKGEPPHLPVDVPTPTLIEYSGYAYADPKGPQSGIKALANIMGYTVVDVNMRGTGCSGGAFDFFEPLQNLDGYDIIETVARQPWVTHGHVGMLGISYGGISQLFTAQTRPPSLAAITPLSVIDNVATTLYPGGILNTGFAFAWTEERVRNAVATTKQGEGQSYAWNQISKGDEVCKENQTLHPEAAPLIDMVRENDTYKPEVVDPLSPVTFVDKIRVPVFMACQHTDEQTGGHCPTLVKAMTGTDKKWFTFTNGVHVDSLSPETFNKLYDFLQIYVAKEAPITKAALIHAAAIPVFQAVYGIDGVTLRPDPIQAMPTYELAKAAWEKQKPVRILFDNGAGDPNNPGFPYPGYEHSFGSFPPAGVKAKPMYFGPGGSLSGTKVADAGADEFTWDAEARPPTNFTGNTGTGDLWRAIPNYNWSQDPPGSAVAYVSKPLAKNVTVVGAGAVRAWIKSSEPNVDLQATISEVRPDGNEAFVQGGWLRGDMRKLDARKSTRLEPVLSLRAEDISPLPADEFVKVTIPLYYQTHAYRAGSRIRVRISAPNGDQPIWAFAETEPAGTAEVQVAYGGDRRSRVDLPVVPGLGVPTSLPPCPGSRGEPCRTYVPLENRPAG